MYPETDPSFLCLRLLEVLDRVVLHLTIFLLQSLLMLLHLVDFLLLYSLHLSRPRVTRTFCTGYISPAPNN